MDRQAVKARIKEIMVEVTGLDPAVITDTASFADDLNLDSLSLLEIMINVDEEFSLKLPDEELKALGNLEETMDLIERHLGEGREAPAMLDVG